MLEIWSNMPWWVRLLVAFGLMGLGVVSLIYGRIRSGSGLLGLGFALFLIGGRSDALSPLFGGRPVDLVTEGCIHPIIRKRIRDDLRVLYAEPLWACLTL